MEIRYVFDVLSPYACLAWHVLQRYKDIWKFDLVLQPVFLGGIMKGSGNKPPATVPARGIFLFNDLEKNSSLFEVPILPSPNNFFSEVAAKVLMIQRLIVAAQLDGAVDVEALITSFTKAIHLDQSFRTESNDLKINEEFISTCCANAGLDSTTTSRLMKASTSPEAKAGLIENTEAALEANAFGVPTFLIKMDAQSDPIFFFGSDRFEQMAHVCNLPYYGPVPDRPSVKSSL
mmetsp:Transcript_23303/g.41207  ORF Transcript_23303/g.41207 Transcript_23303/m.41207 type:complete len:233 (+) Transcript_23303:46-744(+)